MAITTDQKIDFLWKKIGYKAAKTDTADNKGGPNEAIPAVSRIDGEKIWAQSGDIPAVQPTASAGVVTVYSDSATDDTVETTEDATSTNDRSWKTGLTDWIDPAYGSTYLVKVYTDSASSTTPESTGTQVLGGESGYEWYFDYDSGVLHFIGTSVPGSLSGNVIYVKGSRYSGNLGVASSGGGSSHNLRFDPSNLNDLQSTDTNGNINLDPNGTGQVVIEGTNSAVMPVGTTAERGTETAGGVRYNTDTSSFEGYSGTTWAGLGGLIDIDQDTHICAEASTDADELIFTANGTQVAKMADDEIIFNEGGADIDFRVESDTSNKALFVSGYGAGKVGVGTSAPNDQFEVSAYPDDTYIRIQTAADKNTGIRFFNTGNNWAIVNDGCGVYADADSLVIHDQTAMATRLEVKTSGAISIAGALTAGGVTSTGAVTATGKLVTDDTTNATTTTDGALQTDGGLSVVCGAYIGGKITTDDTTNATTTTDGSLQTDGGLSVACDLYIGGDFTVTGTTFTIDSTTLTVADKNLELGTVATPTDGTADGGGITLKGATDKTITWTDSTDSWHFNQGIRTTTEGQGYDGEGGYGGTRFATQDWTSSSNKIVATFNLGSHEAAAWTMHVVHNDWTNHSGGGRIISGIFNSGYGSPGSIISDSYSPSNFADIVFSIGESGDDRYLYASGGDANGPGTVIIMMQGISAGGWSLATS